MIKDIAIFGAGGFGKEVACLINLLNHRNPNEQWNLLGFFDDGKPIGSNVSHFGKVLGGISELNSWNHPISIAIAIGNPATLSHIREKITNSLVSYPNLIDPTFYMADPETFKIGKGNIIQGCCCVSPDVTLGDFNILNGWVVIGHDVTIDSYNFIMPGARISGEVKLGSNNLLGAQSIIIQQIKVGNSVTLAAGSVLMTKPKDNSVYIGVPAKRFKY
jgi:sugar O-acyltransferase (sialic acid O-acetyltransferase NeuD family)